MSALRKRWLLVWALAGTGLVVTIYWSWRSWQVADILVVGRAPQVTAYTICSKVCLHFSEKGHSFRFGQHSVPKEPGYWTVPVDKGPKKRGHWWGKFHLKSKFLKLSLSSSWLFVGVPIWILLTPAYLPLAWMLWSRRKHKQE